MAAALSMLDTGPMGDLAHSDFGFRDGEQGLVERIHGLLRDLDRHVPTFREVARELAMSQRTLRRRLQEFDTSYGEILRRVRLNRAAEWLLDPTLTVDGVAERLGYTEAANFRHAFRRWVGCSPQAFRRQVAVTAQHSVA